MFVAVENNGIAFSVPPVVVTSDETAGVTDEAVVATALSEVVVVALPFGSAASTKAEGGSPPMVSASPAFNAYGALTSSTRGCSACPETCTPTQRACSDVNISAGSPSGLVDPSRTV